MKKLLLIVFMLATGAAAFAQEADCERFKTGKFKYNDPNFGTVIIKRDKDKQIEMPAEGKTEIHGDVKWLNECTYTMTYTKIVNADAPHLIGKKITVEIIESRDNTYTCRVTAEDGFSGTLDVVKMK